MAVALFLNPMVGVIDGFAGRSWVASTPFTTCAADFGSWHCLARHHRHLVLPQDRADVCGCYLSQEVSGERREPKVGGQCTRGIIRRYEAMSSPN